MMGCHDNVNYLRRHPLLRYTPPIYTTHVASRSLGASALKSCVVERVSAEYGDSSFYDDDTQIYPTVEEQMKMARRIAQSLTSPANRNTRGQRMFLKRRERSVDWTVDETNRKRPSVDVVDAEDDLYYNPTPWTATATWKPRPRDLSSVPAAAAMSPIPQLFAPRVPPASTTDERAR